MIQAKWHDVHDLGAGYLDREWLDAIEHNSQNAAELVSSHFNLDAEIDDEGSVWTGTRWLTQTECDAIVALY